MPKRLASSSIRPIGSPARVLFAVLLVLAAPAASGADAVRIDGDTPVLLRAPEPELTALDCGAIERKVQRMEGGLPGMDARIQKAQALVDAARADSKEAFARAAAEVKESGPEILQNLVKHKLDLLHKTGGLKERIKAFDKAGISREDAKEWLRASKGLHETIGKAEDVVGKIEQLEQAPGQFAAAGDKVHDFSQRVANLRASNGSLLEKAGRVYDEAIANGTAKEIGSAVAQYGGPATEIAFEAGHLAIMSGAAAGEGLLANRDLAVHEQNLADMKRARMNLESRLASSRRDLGECRSEVARREAQEAGKKLASQSPPPSTPSAPAKGAKAAGPSAKPLLLVGGLAAAGAAAYGAGVMLGDAAAASSSSGSSGGSSCHNSRNCIASSMGNGCDCGAWFQVCTSGAGAGQACGSGCAAGLLCVNGRCKSSCP